MSELANKVEQVEERKEEYHGTVFVKENSPQGEREEGTVIVRN
jgi:hypothetical protein